jgi:hypothetical protein
MGLLLASTAGRGPRKGCGLDHTLLRVPGRGPRPLMAQRGERRRYLPSFEFLDKGGQESRKRRSFCVQKLQQRVSKHRRTACIKTALPKRVNGPAKRAKLSLI